MAHTLTKRTFAPSVPAGKSLVSIALAILSRWYDRHCERRRLAEMSSDLLQDIGVTPEAARREAAKPFWRA